MRATLISAYSQRKVGKFGRSQWGWWNAVRTIKSMYCLPFAIIMDDRGKCLPTSTVSPRFLNDSPWWELGSRQAVWEPAGMGPRVLKPPQWEQPHRLSKYTNVLRICQERRLHVEMENPEWIPWVWVGLQSVSAHWRFLVHLGRRRNTVSWNCGSAHYRVSTVQCGAPRGKVTQKHWVSL